MVPHERIGSKGVSTVVNELVVVSRSPTFPSKKGAKITVLPMATVPLYRCAVTPAVLYGDCHEWDKSPVRKNHTNLNRRQERLNAAETVGAAQVARGMAAWV